MENLLRKLKTKKRGVTLNCFSPPIMIATFTIEIILAIYVFIKARKAKSDVGIVLLLIFLALFQLSEYQICGGFDALFWARLGLVAITLLPVGGLYLVSKLKQESHLLKFGFFAALAFAAFFALVPHSISETTCTGNYITFDIESNTHTLYAYYYFGFLLLGIFEAVKGIQKPGEKNIIKKALGWFIVGYISFILPLTLVYIFIPITRVAITSIMCGFAVIFAFILAFKIAPIYHEYVKVEPKVKKGIE